MTFSSHIFRRSIILALLFVVSCGGLLRPGLRLGDTVIAGEETWSGTVRVGGVVTVKKSGRLVIEPGTRVLFARVDHDGDGIGDAELLVEGELVARGTDDAPILFSSAEPAPRPADWKYVYLDFARRAEVEHVIAEYAFSGIQVHFCKARIENSVFRHNIDGVRFSTVNIVIRGNRIYNNRHGIRYEERRSTALVTENDIRDNEIGIFVVTRSDDRAHIVRNNIVDNRPYNVKLGITQKTDVTLPNNWWGTISAAAITEGFFDAGRDESLGRVRAPQPLPAPVEIPAGIRQGGER